MSLFINVAPKFDEPTEYSYGFNRKIVAEAKKRGHTVIDLTIEDAIREKVEEALEANVDAFVIHYDHGSENALIGNDERAVIDLLNVHLLSDREVYNMNCSSAKILGVEAYKKKAVAYWGFTDVVYFTTDALPEFEESFNIGFLLKLDGKTWSECLEKVKQRMSELVDKLVDEGKAMPAWCMRNNRDILHCWGDNIEQPPPQESECWFRRLAVRLLGPVGWRIPNPLQWIRQKLLKK